MHSILRRSSLTWDLPKSSPENLEKTNKKNCFNLKSRYCDEKIAEPISGFKDFMPYYLKDSKLYTDADEDDLDDFNEEEEESDPDETDSKINQNLYVKHLKLLYI